MIHSQFFFNRCFDKGKLKGLISWSLRNYGEASTLDLVEKLKDVGFAWANKAGISLSIDDLKIPKEKSSLLFDAEEVSNRASEQFLSGNLTTVERLQQLIDAWHRTSENLKQEVVSNFRRTDPLNPVYMMAFSGARGNISQVRQLVGMRGLMADPQGRIIDFPIRSNFREGLTLTEYVISCYGARKGIVDTALRTATSGYLTRRLVDVAQHVVVSLYDCETDQGIPLTGLKQGAKTLLPLSERILGRVLAEDIPGVASRNTCISEYLSYQIAQVKESITVRSPLLCKSRNGVCQLCYGWSLAHNELVGIGEAVGIIAAQSIGEPGTQLTMRTFHTGGVFSGEIIDQIQAPISGLVSFPKPLKGTLVRTSYGKVGFLAREAGVLTILTPQNETKEITFPLQSILFVRHNQQVLANEILLEYASTATDQDQGIQATHLVTSPQKGEVFFDDVVLITDENRTEAQAYSLGSFWLLTSSSTATFVNSAGGFHFVKGDLLKENSSFSTTKLFNLTKDLARLTNFACNVKPTVITKVADLTVRNLFYRNGTYLGTFDSASQDKVSVSSQKRSVLTYFDKTSISFFGFSSSLTKNPTTPSNRKPNLSVLLTNSEFWFLVGTSLSFKKSGKKLTKLKILEFVKNTLSTKQIEERKASASSKKLGVYSFKSSKKRAVGFTVTNKFYTCSQIFQNCKVSANKKTWKVVLNTFSFSGLKNQKTGSAFYFFTFLANPKKRTALNFQPIVYKPVVQQLPLHFLFSRISTKKATFENFASILFDKQTIFSSVSLCHRTSCFYSFISFLNVFAKTSSLINKQTVDNALLSSSPFIFDCQSVTKQSTSSTSVFLSSGNLRTPVLVMQIQPTFNSDNLRWALNTNGFGTISIFNNSTIILPQNQANDFNSSSVNSFEWQKAKKKIVNDKYILGQINKKTGKKLEIFKFLNQKDGVKMLSLDQTDLTGILIPNRSQKACYVNSSFLGLLVRPGNEILRNKTISESGQILSITKNRILIRKAAPILFSSNASFHVFHGDFVEKGLPLITLTYKRLTTGDIVQGIPRIEQLFEARQTTTILHEQLQELFDTYKSRMRSNLAVRKSFQKIQRILIDSIQHVYQSQGVTISDKHLEVIVRQMTSTVRIVEGGRTRLLRGELKSIEWIEKTNLGIDIQKAEYEPILLGITKASLETESFISAASFQETTRILGRSAIEGRTDFLRGLKENVILGHRIPAGTGAPLISYLTKFSTTTHSSRDFSSDLRFLLKD